MSAPTLREALKPFAEEAEATWLEYTDEPDDQSVSLRATFGQMRAARAALAAPPEQPSHPHEDGGCGEEYLLLSIDLNHLKPAHALHARYETATGMLHFTAHSQTGQEEWSWGNIRSAGQLWRKLMQAKRAHEAEWRPV